MTEKSTAAHLQKQALGWLAALSLVGAQAVTTPTAASAKTQSLDFPRSGVICDPAVRICYDSNGASVSLTRRYFDRNAEQALKRLLSGRQMPREFQFSGGEVCDVRRRLCWDNGWKKTNVSNRLSRQLFGSVDNTGNQWGNNNSNNNIWNNSTNNWNQNQQTSFCDLSQLGRRLFNGSCNLRQRNTSNGTAYSVELQDGRQFAFYNRQGELVLRDNNGTWPVRYTRRGNEVLFNWANMRLNTRAGDPQFDQQFGQQGNPQTYPPSLNPTNQFLQGLFNSLFR